VNLLNSSHFLKVIIENAIDGIIVIDENGTIILANPSTYKLFAYEKGELEGKKINILMPGRFASNHDDYLNHYKNTGERKIIGIGREVVGMKKDGTFFPFNLSISELIINNVRYFAGTVHDISAQKEAQAKVEELNSILEARITERTEQLARVVNTLMETNKALRNEITERKNIELALLKSKEETQAALESEKNLSELKSRFITTASHEFRTPLSTILSSAKLIGRYADESGQESRMKHIKRIETAVKNLNNILYDLLTWNKFEENKILFRPVNFDLTELIKEVIEEVQIDSKIGQDIFYEHEGESKEIVSDPVFIKNILINLLSNAIKYSNEAQSVFVFSKIDASNIYLEVKDYGIGIPAEEQQFLFDRFFRANNVESIQGTGLGLNIVKKYVSSMNGEISFQSEQNKGSSFFIRIPKYK
jgi:two-component system sensor kinase FixL